MDYLADAATLRQAVGHLTRRRCDAFARFVAPRGYLATVATVELEALPAGLLAGISSVGPDVLVAEPARARAFMRLFTAPCNHAEPDHCRMRWVPAVTPAVFCKLADECCPASRCCDDHDAHALAVAFSYLDLAPLTKLRDPDYLRGANRWRVDEYATEADDLDGRTLAFLLRLRHRFVEG